MDGTAVKEIAALQDATQKTVVVDGITYSDRALKPVIFESRRPEPLKFLSLSALVVYLKQNCERRNEGQTFILVDDINRVSLVQEYLGADSRRTVFAKVEPITTDSFSFGGWMDMEKFIINAKTYFLPSDDLSEIIQIASSVSKDSGVDTKDDGVSQQVNVRIGVRGALTEKKETKGIYRLQARRIFPEVVQPEGDFIFRLRPSDPVTAAIFEADGGAWKLQALSNIRSWLESQDLGLPILA